MTTIVDHLSDAAEHLHLVQIVLDLAVKHAIFRHYRPNWIDALNKALTDTQAASRHITNVAKCLAPCSDPPD